MAVRAPRVRGGIPQPRAQGTAGGRGGARRTQIFQEVPDAQPLQGLVAPSEQLPLQRDQAAEQLLAGGLGGRQDDAGVQEILQAPQQLLPRLGQVGVPAEHLRGGAGTEPAPAPRAPRGARRAPSVPAGTRGQGARGDAAVGTRGRGEVRRSRGDGGVRPRGHGDVGIGGDVARGDEPHPGVLGGGGTGG